MVRREIANLLSSVRFRPSRPWVGSSMVEQRPFKPLAVSSSLTQPTILFWTSNGERPRRRPLEVKQIMQENAKKLGTFYCALIYLIYVYLICNLLIYNFIIYNSLFSINVFSFYLFSFLLFTIILFTFQTIIY